MRKILTITGVAMTLLALTTLALMPFRLHVVANSNVGIDQQVKLEVRDAVLSLTKVQMQQCHNYYEAGVYMQTHKTEIEQTAKQVLAENGFTYDAVAYVGDYDFPDKVYGQTTYKAGTYPALRLVLGEGGGENWWCVMFPPLCIVDTGLEANQEQEEIEYSSIFVELFRTIFGG